MKKAVSLLIFALLMMPGAITAAGGLQLTLMPESSLWLEGNSTVHGFKRFAQKINITSKLEIKPAEAEKAKPSVLLTGVISDPDLNYFVLEIPVKELNSPTPGLDTQMHKHLKVKANPKIIFKLTDYKSEKFQNTPGKFRILCSGTLEVAGVSKQVSLDSTAVVVNDSIKLTGSKQLLMTDFKIKPPELMMGMMKTDNAITINWEFFLKASF